tara:strand:- start:547 stop:1530 length:984 start_codon:yes stop_codon:yes gene_type:complete
MPGFNLNDASGNVLVTGDAVIDSPTLYIDDTNGNDANSGSAAGAGNALKTLAAAVTKISNATVKGTVTINVAAGTYYACTFDLDNQNVDEIKILGAGSGTTILSGAANSGAATTAAQDYIIKVTECTLNELKIKDVKIQYAQEANVYLRNISGRVSLEDCVIGECQSSATTSFQFVNGCVVADTIGELEIDGCTIENSQSHCVVANRSRVQMSNTASTLQFPSNGADTKGHCLTLMRESYLEINVDGCVFKGNGANGAGYDAYGLWIIFYSNVIMWTGASGCTLINLKEGRRSQHGSQLVLANASGITYTDCETNITQLSDSRTIDP